MARLKMPGRKQIRRNSRGRPRLKDQQNLKKKSEPKKDVVVTPLTVSAAQFREIFGDSDEEEDFYGFEEDALGVRNFKRLISPNKLKLQDDFILTGKAIRPRKGRYSLQLDCASKENKDDGAQSLASPTSPVLSYQENNPYARRYFSYRRERARPDRTDRVIQSEKKPEAVFTPPTKVSKEVEFGTSQPSTPSYSNPYSKQYRTYARERRSRVSDSPVPRQLFSSSSLTEEKSTSHSKKGIFSTTKSFAKQLVQRAKRDKGMKFTFRLEKYRRPKRDLKVKQDSDFVYDVNIWEKRAFRESMLPPIITKADIIKSPGWLGNEEETSNQDANEIDGTEIESSERKEEIVEAKRHKVRLKNMSSTGEEDTSYDTSDAERKQKTRRKKRFKNVHLVDSGREVERYPLATLDDIIAGEKSDEMDIPCGEKSDISFKSEENKVCSELRSEDDQVSNLSDEHEITKETPSLFDRLAKHTVPLFNGTFHSTRNRLRRSRVTHNESDGRGILTQEEPRLHSDSTRGIVKAIEQKAEDKIAREQQKDKEETAIKEKDENETVTRQKEDEKSPTKRKDDREPLAEAKTYVTEDATDSTSSVEVAESYSVRTRRSSRTKEVVLIDFARNFSLDDLKKRRKSGFKMKKDDKDKDDKAFEKGSKCKGKGNQVDQSNLFTVVNTSGDSSCNEIPGVRKVDENGSTEVVVRTRGRPKKEKRSIPIVIEQKDTAQATLIDNESVNDTKNDHDTVSNTKNDRDKVSDTKNDHDNVKDTKKDHDNVNDTKDDHDNVNDTKDDHDNVSDTKNDHDNVSDTRNDRDNVNDTKNVPAVDVESASDGKRLQRARKKGIDNDNVIDTKIDNDNVKDTKNVPAVDVESASDEKKVQRERRRSTDLCKSWALRQTPGRASQQHEQEMLNAMKNKKSPTLPKDIATVNGDEITETSKDCIAVRNADKISAFVSKDGALPIENEASDNQNEDVCPSKPTEDGASEDNNLDSIPRRSLRSGRRFSSSTNKMGKLSSKIDDKGSENLPSLEDSLLCNEHIDDISLADGSENNVFVEETNDTELTKVNKMPDVRDAAKSNKMEDDIPSSHEDEASGTVRLLRSRKIVGEKAEVNKSNGASCLQESKKRVSIFSKSNDLRKQKPQIESPDKSLLEKSEVKDKHGDSVCSVEDGEDVEKGSKVDSESERTSGRNKERGVVKSQVCRDIKGKLKSGKPKIDERNQDSSLHAEEETVTVSGKPNTDGITKEGDKGTKTDLPVHESPSKDNIRRGDRLKTRSGSASKLEKATSSNSSNVTKLKKVKRLVRCQKCKGCIKEECGVCLFCRDKKKFGGHDVYKKSCIERKCLHPKPPMSSRGTTPKKRQAPNSEVPHVSPKPPQKSPPKKKPPKPKPPKEEEIKYEETEEQLDADITPELRPHNKKKERKESLSKETAEPKIDVAIPVSPLTKPRLRSSVIEERERAVKPKALCRVAYTGLETKVKIPWPVDTDEDAAWLTSYYYCLTYPVHMPRISVCFLCGSGGGHKMISCVICSETFHDFCLELDPLDEEKWCCDRCKFCRVCGYKQNLLMCDKCHDCYHAECLGPNYQKETVGADEIWVCGRCIKCTKCGKKTPGKRKDSKWMYAFTMCDDCSRQWRKGCFCPVCKQVYEEDDFEAKMIMCSICDCWIHMECEGLNEDEYECLTDLPEEVQYVCKLCHQGEEKPAWYIEVKDELQAGFQKVYYELIASRDYHALQKIVAEDEKAGIPPDDITMDTIFRNIENNTYSKVDEFAKECFKVLERYAERQEAKQGKAINANVLKLVFFRYMQQMFPWYRIQDLEKTNVRRTSNQSSELPADAPQSPSTIAGILHDHAYCCEKEDKSEQEKVEVSNADSSSSPGQKSSADGVSGKPPECESNLENNTCHSTSGNLFDDTLSSTKWNIFDQLESTENRSPSPDTIDEPNEQGSDAGMEEPDQGKVHGEQLLPEELRAASPEGLPDNDDLADNDMVLNDGEKTPSSRNASPVPSKGRPVEPLTPSTPGFEDDDRRCLFCNQHGDRDENWAGRLLLAGMNEWVHVNCALWSAEVFEDKHGRLQNVQTAISRGNKLKCDLCQQYGATVGCCSSRCPLKYHFECSRHAQMVFQDDKKAYCKQHSNKVKKELIMSDTDFGVERRVLVDLSRTKSLKKYQQGVEPKSIKTFSGSIVVHRLGHLDAASDSKQALIPMGYRVSRIFWSTSDPRKRCRYSCSIDEREKDKDDIIVEDTSDLCMTGQTIHHSSEDANVTLCDAGVQCNGRTFSPVSCSYDSSTSKITERTNDHGSSNSSSEKCDLSLITSRDSSIFTRTFSATNVSLSEIPSCSNVGPGSAAETLRAASPDIDLNHTGVMYTYPAKRLANMPITTRADSLPSTSSCSMKEVNGVRKSLFPPSSYKIIRPHCSSSRSNNCNTTQDKLPLRSLSSSCCEDATHSRSTAFRDKEMDIETTSSAQQELKIVMAGIKKTDSHSGGKSQSTTSTTPNHIVGSSWPSSVLRDKLDETKNSSSDGGIPSSSTRNLQSDLSGYRKILPSPPSSAKANRDSHALFCSQLNIPPSLTTLNQSALQISPPTCISNKMLLPSYHSSLSHGKHPPALVITKQAPILSTTSTLLNTIRDQLLRYPSLLSKFGIKPSSLNHILETSGLKNVVTGSYASQIILIDLLMTELSKWQADELERLTNILKFICVEEKLATSSALTDYLNNQGAKFQGSSRLSMNYQKATPQVKPTLGIISSIPHYYQTLQPSQPVSSYAVLKAPAVVQPGVTVNVLAAHSSGNVLSGNHTVTDSGAAKSLVRRMSHSPPGVTVPQLFNSSVSVVSSSTFNRDFPVIARMECGITNNDHVPRVPITLFNCAEAQKTLPVVKKRKRSAEEERDANGEVREGKRRLKSIKILSKSKSNSTKTKKSNLNDVNLSNSIIITQGTNPFTGDAPSQPVSHTIRNTSDSQLELLDNLVVDDMSTKSLSDKGKELVKDVSKKRKMCGGSSEVAKKRKLQKVENRRLSGMLKIVLDREKEKDLSNYRVVIKNEEGWRVESNSLEDAWRQLIFHINEIRMDQKWPMLPCNGPEVYDFLGLSREPIVYLAEQLPGGHRCKKYRYQYHLPCKEDDDVELPLNPHGCARAEVVKRSRKEYDMFAWLSSSFRTLPPQLEDADDTVQASAQDLPMAMRYRQLKCTVKDYVGVYQSLIHARGLFCKRPIEVGEMIIEYAGTVIRASLTDRREDYYEKKGYGCYMFRIDDIDVVDATLSGNAARFINHSCEPNCYSKIISVDGQKKIIIFAGRRIQVGEELTYDYKFPIEDEKIPCSCGAKKCRKYLN